MIKTTEIARDRLIQTALQNLRAAKKRRDIFISFSMRDLKF